MSSLLKHTDTVSSPKLNIVAPLAAALFSMIAVIMPTPASASITYSEEFENSGPGVLADHYPSKIGDFKFIQFGSEQGHAFVSTQGSHLQGMEILGSLDGQGVGALEFIPFPKGNRYFELDYQVLSPIGTAKFASIQIVGASSAYWTQLADTKEFMHFAYEHTEPIEKILVFSGGLQQVTVDNYALRQCRICR